MHVAGYLNSYRTVQNTILEAVWPIGRNPAAPWDGTHYILRGFTRPVSVSTCEAFILANCMALSDASLAFEIGTGFGYSASWLALGVAVSGKAGKVITMDNYSEGGLGEAGRAAAKKIATELGFEDIIEVVEGVSPDDVPRILSGRQLIDIAFIDANHHGVHPTEDYLAIQPFLGAGSIIFFHDMDETRYTVPDAVALARREGWQVKVLETSCRLTVAYKDAGWLPIVEESFDNARRNVVLTRSR